MAGRETDKARKGGPKPPERRAAAAQAAVPIAAPALPRTTSGGASADTSGSPAERLAAMEAECERLRAELARAQSEIADMRVAREQALNRIDWVIDSLHNLLDE